MPVRHLIMHYLGGGAGVEFCDVAKMAIGPDEDLAKFGYMLNKKIQILHILLKFWLTISSIHRNLRIFFPILVELWLLKISKDT
jgi:hypothetical protein